VRFICAIDICEYNDWGRHGFSRAVGFDSAIRYEVASIPQRRHYAGAKFQERATS
jgi:hypothetical protein